MGRRFHNGLAVALVRAAEAVRQESSLERVCLSGGVFQNAVLLERLSRGLEQAGFEVFTHAEVPAGDGGLSLGQAVIGAHGIR